MLEAVVSPYLTAPCRSLPHRAEACHCMPNPMKLSASVNTQNALTAVDSPNQTTPDLAAPNPFLPDQIVTIATGENRTRFNPLFTAHSLPCHATPCRAVPIRGIPRLNNSLPQRLVCHSSQGTNFCNGVHVRPALIVGQFQVPQVAQLVARRAKHLAGA